MEKVFPNVNADIHSPGQQLDSWIAEGAMQTSKHSSFDQINAIISKEPLPGEALIQSSADSTSDPRDSNRFPVKFLNKLTPAGHPPHHLYMKKCLVHMLLRNISPKKGLCNGTLIILNKAANILFYRKIASGDNTGEEVLNARIEIKHQYYQFIEWNRRKFQVRLAFAMTINKRQDQTQQNTESDWRSQHLLMGSSISRPHGQETLNIFPLQ